MNNRPSILLRQNYCRTCPPFYLAKRDHYLLPLEKECNEGKSPPWHKAPVPLLSPPGSFDPSRPLKQTLPRERKLSAQNYRSSAVFGPRRVAHQVALRNSSWIPFPGNRPRRSTSLPARYIPIFRKTQQFRKEDQRAQNERRTGPQSGPLQSLGPLSLF